MTTELESPKIIESPAMKAAKFAEQALASEYPEIEQDLQRELHHHHPHNDEHIIPSIHDSSLPSHKKQQHHHTTKEPTQLSSVGAKSSHLHESEFGELTSTKYLYKSNWPAGKSLPKEEEDLPSLYVFVTTYLSYLVLIIMGHVEDFFARIFRSEEHKYLQVSNGFAPFVDEFESFYVRRQKHRLNDCFGRVTTGVPGRYITVLDRTSDDFYTTFKYPGTTTNCLNLSSYNYLGFAQSAGQCTDTAEIAIRTYGPTSGAPRLAGGATDYHVISEKVVADFLGKESSLIYSMGYGTNATIFSALIDKNCLVISDELNHASIRFGVRMSGAVIRIFKHNDMEDLERVLREQISQGQPRTHRPWKKILIIVEGLYSMEGTMCNLPELVRLRKKYKFYLFVDEAHSVGAIGPRGRGVADFFSIDPSEIDIMMGTLTKSFGATGGYIAANKDIIDKIKVTNLANIYAESPAPPVLAQINSSLLTITGDVNNGEGQERLQRIAFNSRYLRLGLKKLGFIVSGMDDSPIIPVMLYHPTKMPAFSRLMLEKKIAVVVVGYPATPLTSSRVRLCVSASLTKEDLDYLLREMDIAGDELHFKMSCELSPKTGKLRRENVEDVLKTLVDDVQQDLSQF